MIENNNITINTLKQIKYSLIKGCKEESSEDITQPEIVKVINNSRECLHLYDLNFKEQSSPKEENIKSVSVNYFDILKREEESKKFKNNLLMELQEFQEGKEHTLEELLNNE